MNLKIVELINKHKIDFEKQSNIHPYWLSRNLGSYDFKTNKIFINLPLIKQYNMTLQSVMLHELIHWTGGVTQLNRKFFSVFNSSKHYPNKILEAEEELIAQFGALELARIYNLNKESYIKMATIYMNSYGKVKGINQDYILDSVGKSIKYLQS